MDHEDSNREVKDHELVSFEEKDLPDLVKKTEVDYSDVQGHDPLCGVHLNHNLALA
jgi:hypothetical protein